MSQNQPDTNPTARLQLVFQQIERAIEDPDRYKEDTSVDWRDYMHDLGCSLRDNFQVSNNRQWMELAIRCLEKTVGATSRDDPEVAAQRAERRLDLAMLYAERFKLSGNSNDIDEAVRLGYLAVEDTTGTRPGHSTVLMVQSGLLGDRFALGSSHDLADAQASIRLGGQALDQLDLLQGRKIACLHNLSATYGDLFARTGDLECIEAAMQYQQRALALVPERTTEWAHGLYELSLCLRQRYLRLYELEDLHQAIATARLALETHEMLYSDQVELIRQLCGCLLDRFARTKDRRDLDEAIQQEKLALDQGNRLGLEQSTFSRNLCIAMQKLFFVTGELSDLQAAITYGQSALQKIEEAHESDYNIMHNLASCYACRSTVQESTHRSDINEAIRLEELALKTAPEHHPHFGECLQSLAVYYRAKHSSSALISDAKQSIGFATRALRCESAAPLTRIMAGLSAASFLAISQHWDESMTVFDESLDLLPKISPLTTMRLDLQESLRKLPNSASLAASSALKAGRSPIEAIQILERGRGVIESFVINARMDPIAIKESHEDLYRRYMVLRDKLALPVESQPISNSAGLTRGDHHALELLRRSQTATALDETIREIRQIPGSEFLPGAMQQGHIQKLAAPYPIAYINISVVGTEAFLIRKDNTQYLPLPGLTRSFLKNMLSLWNGRSFSDGRPAKIVSSTSRASINIRSAMLTLWKEAVRPILENFGFMRDSQNVQKDALPRICWIGSEMASLVPFHAAGDHSLGSTENTISHVVSSYATSLKSLHNTRREIQAPTLVTANVAAQSSKKLLIAAMPTTPGIAGRLAVEEEVSAVIQSAAYQYHSITTIVQPSKQDILSEVLDCAVFHFAGHGNIDPDDPGQSALWLGRASVEELRVRDLDPLRLSMPQLAYLSACSTAEAASRQLIDENVHLAGAFTLAGFPSVVGTLWRAEDSSAVMVASEFYKQLGNNVGMARGESVARALHAAILRLRGCKGSNGDLLTWAPFVHLGD